MFPFKKKKKKSYSLVGVLNSKINIFSNKQTFHIQIITIIKIKSLKKYYFLDNIII